VQDYEFLCGKYGAFLRREDALRAPLPTKGKRAVAAPRKGKADPAGHPPPAALGEYVADASEASSAYMSMLQMRLAVLAHRARVSRPAPVRVCVIPCMLVSHVSFASSISLNHVHLSLSVSPCLCAYMRT
jgi:hypothetical protein